MRPLGLSFDDPSVGEFMKGFGYATGQFGKNHLGDRNEHLPTVHGFDEFFGNLYHLNAEEEPEYENYPKDPAFRKKYGPRGVLKCKATDKDDATVDPQFGKVGKQSIENTGPLSRKRMETVDEEFLGAALDLMERKTKEKAPGSAISTRPACTFSRILRSRPRARPASACTLMAWWNWTATWGSYSRSSRTSASPTTPSSCSPPTMARKCSRGPTAARRRSAAKRTPTGKVAGEFRASCAGRASLRQGV